jgi:acetate---CoA ligase (ADP-forming)
MLENEIYEWLREKKIHTPEHKLFELNEEPEADFYPAALKIESSKVIHKSEVGGVALNLKNKEELKKAKETILSNLRRNGIEPGEQDKFLVSRMYSGIELFFGIVNDPVFEKVIVFGTGGIFAELYKDICFIDSEAGDEEIMNAIAQTKISILFRKGFRGKKYDIKIIVDFVKKLQQLDANELDLNPVILNDDTLTVVDARLLESTKETIRKKIKYVPEIFTPRKIAIIGVSEHPEKVGYALAKNSCDYAGVFFVNPKLESLFGRKVYQCIEDLPLIDTAVIAIPAPFVKDYIEKLVAKKVKNVIVITAGFKEAGKEESFLTDLANTHHLNIIGPNCLGVHVNGVNLTFGSGNIEAGPVNLFSQSGAIVAELMDKATEKNIGFENIVSLGNMADIDFGDLINSYPGNNPINLYIEGIANGKNLLRAIRKTRSQVKIFKAGRSEVARKAAFSHTGNMAGNYEMFVGLLQSAGCKIIKDVNGLLYPHHFEKIVIVTNAGGAGTVMSDLINDKLYTLNPGDILKLNKVLPSHWSKNNPVDIIGDACHERYLKTLQVADNFNADAIYVIVTPQFMTDTENISRIFIDAKFRTKVIPVLLGGESMEAAKTLLQRNKIEFFEELNEAVSFL